jgi:hypothetical protein
VVERGGVSSEKTALLFRREAIIVGSPLSSLAAIIVGSPLSLCFTVINRQTHNFKVVVYYSVPNTKLCAWGEEDSGGHVL